MARIFFNVALTQRYGDVFGNTRLLPFSVRNVSHIRTIKSKSQIGHYNIHSNCLINNSAHFWQLPKHVIRVFGVKLALYYSTKLNVDKQLRVTKNKISISNADTSTMKSLNNLLISAGSSPKPHDVCAILERIVNLCKTNVIKKNEITDLCDSKEFLSFTNILHESALTLNVSLLNRALQSLLFLCEKDLLVVESLEKQAIWLMKTMTISELIQTASIHLNHIETDLRKSVLKAAFHCISLRKSELSSPSDIVTLLYILPPTMPEVFKTLEEKALVLCQQMNVKDLYSTMYCLGKQKRRNVPLLIAISFHLNKAELNLDLKHIANLFYACANLNFYEEPLLANMAKNISATLNSADPINKSEISFLYSIMQSISVLRYRKPDFLDLLVTYLINNGIQNEESLSTLLLTCATLNYSPSTLKMNVTKLIEPFEHLHKANPKMWLNIVWCMTVLDMLTPKLAESVLNADFIGKIKSSGISKNPVAQLQLLNINCAAKLDLSSYDGSLLPNDYVKSNNITIPLRTNRPLLNSVLLPMTTMFPQDRYLRFATVTDGAHIIDIEMVINNKGDPQPIAKFNDEQIRKDKNNKRLAFKVLDYTDITRSTQLPVGIQALAIRHLTKLSYFVVEVPYFEIGMDTKVAKLVHYLKEKISVVSHRKS